MNLIEHLYRQRAWSLRTFGPGDRTAGVSDHIRKELRELEAAPADLSEWADVVLLAFDGAWRTGASPEAIVAAIEAKQTKNEGREWPDWRTTDPTKAIEHVRGADEAPKDAPPAAAASAQTSVKVTLYYCARTGEYEAGGACEPAGFGPWEPAISFDVAVPESPPVADATIGAIEVHAPKEADANMPTGPYEGWLKGGSMFVTDVPELGGATLAAAQVAPAQIHDPVRDQRITDLMSAHNREVERRREALGAMNALGEALGELLHPYSGGAANAFEDPYIRERAERVYRRAVEVAVQLGDAEFQPTHMHLKSQGLYRLLLLGEMEADGITPVAIYAGVTGRVWIRPLAEFMDGRFKRIGGEGAL